ncbi:MAG: Fe-S cluster assembly protein SufD [Bradyrhizobiaceae bacterium]|nr:MAG: Fe-S cluster assembly protein SufD [Bradyrhizobiaceae bacterium]
MAADLAIVRSPAEEALLARYPAFRARQAHWGGPSVARQREEAFDALKARGLPNRRVEDWKYTDLRALMREAPEPFESHTRELSVAAEAMRPVIALAEAKRILFVNGRSVFTGRADPARDGFEYASLLAGAEPAPSLAAALARERPYADNAAVALNTAFMADTVLLRVPAGTKVAQPLHLAFRELGEAPFSTYPRVLVVLEEGAELTLVETHDGPDGVAYQTAGLVEFEIADGARLDHVYVNAHGDAALNLWTFGVRLGRAATIASLAMTFGAAVTRQQFFVTQAGPDARIDLRGATMLRGSQHCDSTLVVDHALPGGVSRETFKTVLDDTARGVFQGKIVVRQHAQKTDGRMASHALLLSEDAEADNKPELEIFADDVQCGHGATSGALDRELLFYLKARGIPAKEAEALLIQAFLGEAVEGVAHEGLREALMAPVAAWLAARSR